MLQEIRSFAVVGAGNMGSGIAQKIATEGFPVTLVDLDEEKVARGLATVRKTLEQGVARRIFRPEQVDPILGRIHGTADWSGLKSADLVIEAVFEDLDVKRKVFGRLDEVCRPETLLATNTSSFFVKDLAAATAHPGRVLGLHYFFHPAKNRLVEVVPHEGTRPEAIQAAWAAQEALGKIPIRSADAPGFVVNRFFVPWLNEAVRLLEEGLADIPTIEEAARTAFRIGMGPFELMNVTGVPIALHAAETLGHALHPFYAPAERLRAQVAGGEKWDLSGKADPSRFETVADRLLGVTFFIAASLVEEKVASVEDTDLGARVGLRWPKGPFELMNRIGIPRVRALAEAVVLEHGLTLPGLLARADEETGIPVRLVVLDRQDGLSRISIRRPDALNALNEAVVLQLENAFRLARAEERPGLMLAASGKAFIAGADIKFFVDNLKAGSFARIHAFTEQGQKLLRTLSGGPGPVVARVQGLALGGGAEVALACDWIAASPKASFGFPETGLGIYPGLGGTARLPRRVGLPLAKFLVYTGQILDASTALAWGLIDEIAPFAGLDPACGRLVAKGPAPRREAPPAPRDSAWQPVWDFFDTYSVDQILSGQADTGGDPRLEKARKKMARKSSHALRLAERLFLEGADKPLAEALELELAHLEEVFSNADALEGLRSLLEGRAPAFAGA